MSLKIHEDVHICGKKCVLPNGPIINNAADLAGNGQFRSEDWSISELLLGEQAWDYIYFTGLCLIEEKEE